MTPQELVHRVLVARRKVAEPSLLSQFRLHVNPLDLRSVEAQLPLTGDRLVLTELHVPGRVVGHELVPDDHVEPDTVSLRWEVTA